MIKSDKIITLLNLLALLPNKVSEARYNKGSKIPGRQFYTSDLQTEVLLLLINKAALIVQVVPH